MKSIITVFIAASVFCVSASAQSVTGKWYGVGHVKKAGSHNSYLSELIIKQNGRKVTGQFNYFFRNAEVKTKLVGTYNPKTREMLLNAQPVLNFQAKNVNGAECPMEGSFTLKVSRVETTLIGQFNPVFDYRFTCPAITVKFVKEVPSPAPLPTYEEEEDVAPPLLEVPQKIDPIINALNERIFEASPVIEVDADSLKVTFYDNGQVDKDTISIFYNRKLVGYKKMLSTEPLTFMLPLDTAVNEIAMYAENMGEMPPNSAVAIIYANEKRFELNMSSTFIKNATIRFRRKLIEVDPKNTN